MLTVGIDPGHGMSNRTWGVYDPGAVHDDLHEARVALAVAMELRDQCLRRGWRTFMTRATNAEAAPLRERVPRARAAQCDCLISLHCNAHAGEQAHGTETLHRASEGFAAEVQRRLFAALATADRGVKRRDDLAILRYERPVVLVELGFISNAGDRDKLTDPARQLAAARAIAEAINQAAVL
jgi:N-acetylmuramoyl-L-alanine amidase